MNDNPLPQPDSTAVRVALWRAMHVLIDPPPHALEDEIGLKLVAPDESWRSRPDMHPQGTAPFRASIVARARFIEDFVTEQSQCGVNQFVLLGAGLDTFAQRRPEIASKLNIFEIDKPDTQAWKKRRLIELGYEIPEWLKFVPVNFESDVSWWEQLNAFGFEKDKPAVVASIGVSMYLTMDAIEETLRQMSKLAPHSTFIMTFMLPLDLVNPEDKFGYEMSLKGAQRSGTPFISFFSPEEMQKFALKTGFRNVESFSTQTLSLKHFAGRSDGLKASSGEEILIART